MWQTEVEIIVHRVNTVNQLMATERQYGAEIDIRVRGSDLILAHDPFEEGEYLIDYLDSYQHGTLILNIKESGNLKQLILGAKIGTIVSE